MAHYAKVVNGIVEKVIVAEAEFFDTFVDDSPGQWIQTSYNTSANTHNSGDNSKAFRGNYAGIGYTWDEDNEIFWPKKPFASWVKDTTTATWKSPIGDAPALTAEQNSQNEAGTHSWGYNWDESGQSWDLTDRLA